MWTTVESTNGGISLIGKAGVLKTPSNHVKVMCRFESDFLLHQINEIMSYGKKWKMTRKQIGRTHIAEDGNIKFVEEEKENADSNFLDIKSGSRL